MTELNTKFGSNRLDEWPKPIERRNLPLEEMSREQLVKWAEDMGVTVAKSWVKNQIIDAINANSGDSDGSDGDPDNESDNDPGTSEETSEGAEDADEDEDEETQENAAPA